MRRRYRRRLGCRCLPRSRYRRTDRGPCRRFGRAGYRSGRGRRRFGRPQRRFAPGGRCFGRLPSRCWTSRDWTGRSVPCLRRFPGRRHRSIALVQSRLTALCDPFRTCPDQCRHRLFPGRLSRARERCGRSRGWRGRGGRGRVPCLLPHRGGWRPRGPWRRAVPSPARAWRLRRGGGRPPGARSADLRTRRARWRGPPRATGRPCGAGALSGPARRGPRRRCAEPPERCSPCSARGAQRARRRRRFEQRRAPRQVPETVRRVSAGAARAGAAGTRCGASGARCPCCRRRTRALLSW